MNLMNAKLGDQFRIFIDASNRITATPGTKTLLATVIAIKKPKLGSGIILGWKDNEARSADAVSRSGLTNEENDYFGAQAQYRWGKTVARELPVAVQIFNGLDGFPCKKCTNFFPLSEANQPDGTLICWSCRDSHKQ